MKVEKRDVYVADDGKVFDTAEACQAHERAVAEQAKRLDNLVVYRVNSSFDGTEGRGYYRTSYIVTDASLEVVIEYCLDRFGRPLSAWYGDGFYEAWILRQVELTAIEAISTTKKPHPGIGLGRGEVDLVFISNKSIDHPDLPAPVFPWPKATQSPKPRR